MGNVEASLKEIDRAVGELGLKGLALGSNVIGPPLNDPCFEPLWKRINELCLPVVEHPMFPKDTSDMGEFELPLRVGLMFDTTLMAARMIYAGIFERYPDFPFVLAHSGAALIMLLERLDNGFKLEFPVLQNPAEGAFKLLLGQNIDFVTLTGQYHFDARVEETYNMFKVLLFQVKPAIPARDRKYVKDVEATARIWVDRDGVCAPVEVCACAAVEARSPLGWSRSPPYRYCTMTTRIRHSSTTAKPKPMRNRMNGSVKV